MNPAAALISAITRVRTKAPGVAWYLVTEQLHPLGKTVALGY